MVFVRCFFILFFFSGCQIGHLIHVSYNHLAILNSSQSIDKILSSNSYTEEQKQKIRLTQEVKEFAYSKLQIKKTKNYSRFVELNRPYVVYNLNASEKWKFEPYLWSFPIIGKAPYIGFYSEALAKEKAEYFKKQNFDTSVRGVRAYSTLGKLTDPLLSSMLNYNDYDLVNTIIHELVHTHIFIKDNINFNERLAVFVANKGSELFYLDKEGPQSPTLKKVKKLNHDDQLFSNFITNEIESLKKWYADFDHSKNLPPDEKEKIRQERLELISKNFEKKLKPLLTTNSYQIFFNKKLNNADLIDFNTYMKNLDVFEQVYRKLGSNLSLFLEKCETLKDSDNPEEQLAHLAD